MIDIDCHLHTTHSYDGKASMEEMVKEAVRLNLKEICFAEHYDYDDPNPNNIVVDCDEYRNDFLELKQRFDNVIKLKFGIEIGFQAHIAHHINEFIKSNSFDFVIGSNHAVNIDGFVHGETEGLILSRHFENVLNCVQAIDDFDSYGHLDHLTRYFAVNNPIIEEYKDVLIEILKTIISKEKALEINSSGFRYGLNQTHPHINILKLYKSLGGEFVTVGSDAHKTKHVGSYFDIVEEMLKSAGFEHITIYEGREPKLIKI